MKIWDLDPSPQLETLFRHVAETRMVGLPILNPALQVEAVGFRRAADGHWVGAMVTPWSLNLLRLCGQAEGWPDCPTGAKLGWDFASGHYEFMVADEAQIGSYHLCSLFSPMSEFESHDQARLTAEAAMAALDEPPTQVAAQAASAPPPSRRRRPARRC